MNNIRLKLHGSINKLIKLPDSQEQPESRFRGTTMKNLIIRLLERSGYVLVDRRVPRPHSPIPGFQIVAVMLRALLAPGKAVSSLPECSIGGTELFLAD